MDEKNEIANLKGRVYALEMICGALARAMPSTTPSGHSPQDIFFKELRSLKTQFDDPTQRRLTDTQLVAGFSKTVQDIEKLLATPRNIRRNQPG